MLVEKQSQETPVEIEQGLAVSSHTGLRGVSGRDGIYLGLRYGIGILVGFANMFALTWWIGPHAYGLFITAIGLSSFLANLTRAGTDTYLVRREDAPGIRLYHVASTLIMSCSLLLTAAGIAAIPLLAAWYRSREFVMPYVVTLITVPLAGLAGPPIAKLERELNFRSAAGIELSGQVLALLVSVTLAWRRCGVWAPVAGVIVWQLWVAIAACRAARLIPRPAFDRCEAHAMLSFGLGYTFSQRVWQLRSLVNPLLVGRLVGAEGVAFVALAVRIGESLGFVRVAAGRLAIAGLSRLREEPARLRAALQNALELQVVVLGPLLCLFAVTGPYLVPRLFGQRWTPSLQVYPWVAAGVLINSVFNLQSSALFVLGEQWAVLRTYCVHVGLFGAGTLLLVAHFGLPGYGWADLLACVAYFLQHQRLAKHVHLRYSRLAGWCLVFGISLFAMMFAGRWAWILWAPLLALMLRELRSLRRAGHFSAAMPQPAFRSSWNLPQTRSSNLPAS